MVPPPARSEWVLLNCNVTSSSGAGATAPGTSLPVRGSLQSAWRFREEPVWCPRYIQQTGAWGNDTAAGKWGECRTAPAARRCAALAGTAGARSAPAANRSPVPTPRTAHPWPGPQVPRAAWALQTRGRSWRPPTRGAPAPTARARTCCGPWTRAGPKLVSPWPPSTPQNAFTVKVRGSLPAPAPLAARMDSKGGVDASPSSPLRRPVPPVCQPAGAAESGGADKVRAPLGGRCRGRRAHHL